MNTARSHGGRPRLESVKFYRLIPQGNSKNRSLHRLRAELALGKPLPRGVIVHHADGSRRDDAPLVICQDRAYHNLLHRRMRVKAAGGNPNTDLRCSYCKQAKPMTDFYETAAGHSSDCKACLYAHKVSKRAS